MYRFKTSHLFIVPSFVSSLKYLTLNTCERVTSAHHLFCILLVLMCTCNITSVVCASSKTHEPKNSNDGKILVETNNQLQLSDEQDLPENVITDNKSNNNDENNSPGEVRSSQNQPFSIDLKGKDKKNNEQIKDDRETSSLLNFFSKTKGAHVVQLTERSKSRVQNDKRDGLVNSRSWTDWFANNFLHNDYMKPAKKDLLAIKIYNKYRLQKLRRSTPPTTTEFIPDDDELNTATENSKKKTTAKPDPRDKSRVSLSVKRGPEARYENGSLCPTDYEERFCWNDGSCPWYDICKLVHCVISCVRRKGEEWLSVKHDSVGIHLRDVKLVEEIPQSSPPTNGKSKKQIKSEKKNSIIGKGKGKPSKQDKGKDKKKQKEKGNVSKNQGKSPTTSLKKKLKS